MKCDPRLSCVVICLMLVAARSVPAQDKGQEDLDKATELKIVATSLDDLAKVAQLCESALEKGLSAENQVFAKQLLTGTLFQRAAQVCRPIFELTPPDSRWPLLRRVALNDLEKIVQFNERLGEAQLLIARLEILPGGNRDNALRAVDKAAAVFAKDKVEMAKVLVIRAALREKPEDTLADLSEALQFDPENADAWRERALYFLRHQDFDAAVADFRKLLENDQDNVVAHGALAEVLTNQKKYDEARIHCDKAVELAPESPIGYMLRARLGMLQEKLDEALADLNKALDIEPTDLPALLLRARLHAARGDLEAAQEDVDGMLQVAPGLSQALLLKAMLAAVEGDFDTAIGELEKIVAEDADAVAIRTQLAAYYHAAERPRKAIETYTQVIDKDPANAAALRGRADALLSVGKHVEAVKDFEAASKLDPANPGILNNLAWVLATSPDDALRDGKRAIELGTKACELTEYKQAHILSTLAAGFAETGDFETALKWSTKAVELSDEEHREQLQKEVESYQAKKPWRERQDMKEKAPRA